MKNKFYVTTAINYPNSKPHMGHAYEAIIADVMARWQRLNGKNVYFLTGTDEHGQKIQNTAKQNGKSPKEFVDEQVKHFKDFDAKLNISFDRFIRTTDEDHIKFVKATFKKVYAKKEIYKGEYEGLYCEGCEAFYLERDLLNGKCPTHDKEVQKVKEESYFFKLGDYQKKIIDHIKKNKDFILPESRRNEILNRLEEPLKDLSVSRTSFNWGIEVPFDKKHVVYVWFDALENYYSGGKKYWPADVHNVGKDILWFHSVIWPAILMSINEELPKTIFAHGFINTETGEKMSKSRGTVVDPIEIANKYGTDALRYFLLREIPFGEDGNFSEEALKNRINNELANDLGNLVNRVLTLVEKKCNGKVSGKKNELLKRLDLKKIETEFDNYRLNHWMDEIWRFVQECNKYTNEKEPWKLEGKEAEAVLYNLVDSLRAIAILVEPVIPASSIKINEMINAKKGSLKTINKSLKSYNAKKGEILFRKVE